MYIYIAAVMLILVALMVVSAYRMKPHVTESPTVEAEADTDESDANDVESEEANGDNAE